MRSIPQNEGLINNLLELLAGYEGVFKQRRIYGRVVGLVLAEVLAFGRHTVTQLLMGLGLTEEDWSAWYRLFSGGRFDGERASEVLLEQTLEHVREDEVYVVGGDATQTARSSRRIEGSSWLPHPRTPAFKMGIHAAQRWFNGSWLMPPEGGYSRALPLRWLPAFTVKSKPVAHAPCSEGQAALAFVSWLRQRLNQLGRVLQVILMVGDGRYDNLEVWRDLPEGVILLARSAKNRVLYHLPDSSPGRGRPRQYGQRARTPQQVWQERHGWRKLEITVRGKVRHLQVKVCGPFVRQGAAHRPLMLIVVRGKHNAHTRRQPLPFLVNALQDEHGQWVLPLPLETLLFWAWQRWELEVCHRELKSNFGLGHKQCFNPIAAVTSVQWSAWVYALLLLAAYRSWGLCAAPPVPTRWWRGAPRWSFNTLWRAYRAALWGSHEFRPLLAPSPADWFKKEQRFLALRNTLFASARS
jgi:hypothetical protein